MYQVQTWHDIQKKRNYIFPWFLFLRSRKNFPEALQKYFLSCFIGQCWVSCPFLKQSPAMAMGLSWLGWFNGAQHWMFFSMWGDLKIISAWTTARLTASESPEVCPKHQITFKSPQVILVHSEDLELCIVWGRLVTMVSTVTSIHRMRLLTSLRWLWTGMRKLLASIRPHPTFLVISLYMYNRADIPCNISIYLQYSWPELETVSYEDSWSKQNLNLELFSC